MIDSFAQIDWLAFSGLPAQLNKARGNGWIVFRTIAELETRAHRRPEPLEIAPAELAERCGLPLDTIPKILEALRKAKVLRCFIPESLEETALVEIRLPLPTPRSPDQVALLHPDPALRDPAFYRYARAEAEPPLDEKKLQELVDYYFNHLSQKMNSIILEQIEIASRRFPAESVRLAIDRAERHEIRNMTWVLKELIRDRKKEKPL